MKCESDYAEVNGAHLYCEVTADGNALVCSRGRGSTPLEALPAELNWIVRDFLLHYVDQTR